MDYTLFYQWRKEKLYVVPINAVPCAVANNDNHSNVIFLSDTQGQRPRYVWYCLYNLNLTVFDLSG